MWRSALEGRLAPPKSDDTIRLDGTSLHRLDQPRSAVQLRPYLKAATEVNPPLRRGPYRPGMSPARAEREPLTLVDHANAWLELFPMMTKFYLEL